MKLSLTSVMLPRWDLKTTFQKLGEHGYEGIELRCRYNDPNAELSYWGRHLTDVSPDNILDKAAQIRDLSNETGVRVCTLASNFTYDKWDFSDLREGIADIPQIIQDLKDVGYRGYVSLEEFGPGDDEEKISSQGNYLKSLMQGA